MRDYVLGLDLGPNSIGWALIDADFSKGEPIERGFLDTSAAGHPPLGVRIFEAGLDRYGSTKKQPKSQARRQARSMRRVLARRRARKVDLAGALRRAGLLPAAGPEWDQLMRECPYDARAQAVKTALSPWLVGRALYHLAQRRGFKSNRKSGKAVEDKGIKKQMAELASRLEESGHPTLGALLNENRRLAGPTIPTGRCQGSCRLS